MSRLLNLHKIVGDLAPTAPAILAHPEVAKAIEQQLGTSHGGMPD
jgi:hypothetical protein